MRIKINCHHKGRIKMQSVKGQLVTCQTHLVHPVIAGSCHLQSNKIKSSVILHLGCYTNTIKNSQHFFFDWLLKGLELSHTQSP